MDSWNKFDEPSLHGKENFYGHLNMDDVTDVDYGHPGRICKDFEIRI